MPNGVIQRGVIISSLTINLALGDAVGAIIWCSDIGFKIFYLNILIYYET